MVGTDPVDVVGVGPEEEIFVAVREEPATGRLRIILTRILPVRQELGINKVVVDHEVDPTLLQGSSCEIHDPVDYQDASEVEGRVGVDQVVGVDF